MRNRLSTAIISQNNLNNMILYKGTIPTVTETFNFSTSAHAANALTSTLPVSLTSANATMAFNTTPTGNATVTGEATWFAIFSSVTQSNAIIGTIGSQADGVAPMTLTSTSLVSGSAIGFSQFSISLN
jgi:hypothetical protein